MSDRQEKLRPCGMELFEIKPVLLGGDPLDPRNKTWLTRQQHFEAVRYWNQMILDLRNSSKKTKHGVE